MITKKEQVMGREVTLELGFIQALQNFFGAVPAETRTISKFGEQYLAYKKKIVSEGKAIRWGLPTSGKSKEQAGIRRIQKRYERSDF